ncbi:hypothetical protein [Hirschia baltica]|uniref:Uncharacterized protein n=1 Tax=Hirschia baltica (strain ATCC 49814 / DSM 5838 / IFAM 1418) TaxID=582402 RepID=C6XL98_HIRBI|nr:hypothetical protein [Hirschia baltica]ACT59697.1 hypothetical protein Hbal_2014 [Hirschia baltica ATCC 49814]
MGLVSAFFYLAGAQITPIEALNIALLDAEPVPSMRAAFRASISSSGAVREIEYDPLKPLSRRFRISRRVGVDEELDAIVDDWAREVQPDVRLFADDLRSSLGQGNIVQTADGWNVQFQHKLSNNDGPVDALVSQQMVGGLNLDANTGLLSRLEYSINKPFKTPEGAWVDSYRQVYSFGRSEQWGVTFVTGYDLYARGGRFGVKGERTFSVKVTDVAFSLASDANQQLESKRIPTN